MASTREANRELVTAFFTMAFDDQQPREACERYVGERYIQHNPFVGDGVDSFVEYVERMSPHRAVERRILRVIADDELVALHNLVRQDPDDRGTIIVDIFRVDNGKIVEHWDVQMPMPDPATVRHGNGVL